MSSEIRMYTGPLNNRIDRVESVGNTFRISGVPNHIQKTNVYIQEEIKLERLRTVGITADTIVGEAGDFEALANRHTYRLPSYPHTLPQEPRAGEICVDPLALIRDQSVSFRRWALNRSFDRVRWRSDNSINEFDSQVFDTIELQPWLSHSDCTTDISRSEKSIAHEQSWHDFKSDEDRSDPGQPDVTAPLSYRSRILFGTHTDNGDLLNYDLVDLVLENTNPHAVPISVLASPTYQLKYKKKKQRMDGTKRFPVMIRIY